VLVLDLLVCGTCFASFCINAIYFKGGANISTDLWFGLR